MRLASFFSYPSIWTKGAAARDKKGNPYNLNEFRKKDFDDGNRLESFSLYGAIAFLYSHEKEPESREKNLQKLKAAIRKYSGKNYSVAEFNDHPETTFEDIKNVLKIANE